MNNLMIKSTKIIENFVCTLILLATLITSVEGQDQDDLIITSISFEEDNVFLQWEGGLPPYSVESSNNLSSWSERVKTDEKSALIPVSQLEFFRLKGSTAIIPKGPLLGQLSVGQGEFNDPLEIHRLKSYWKFYLPKGGTVSQVPSQFFKDLILNLEFLDFPEAKVIKFEGKLSDLPSARFQTSGQIMRVNWIWGEGTQRRRFSLEVNFPYPVNSTRNETIHLSDPNYTLSCSYSVEVDELVFWPELKTEKRKSDSVYLYELPEQEVPKWYNKNRKFTHGGINVETAYMLGVPNFRGSLAWIFKTPVLLEWKQMKITGVVDEDLLFKNNFAQTYQPGHHNFWEYFIADPYLEPEISEPILNELEERNIKYIYFFYSDNSFNGERQIAYIGFDGVVRKP